MNNRKKILRVFIIIILTVFLASTALMSVMYLGGKATQGDPGQTLSGDVVNSGTTLDAKS